MGSENTHKAVKCTKAIQGYPRSLISNFRYQFESTYATCYWWLIANFGPICMVYELWNMATMIIFPYTLSNLTHSLVTVGENFRISGRTLSYKNQSPVGLWYQSAMCDDILILGWVVYWFWHNISRWQTYTDGRTEIHLEHTQLTMPTRCKNDRKIEYNNYRLQVKLCTFPFFYFVLVCFNFK